MAHDESVTDNQHPLDDLAYDWLVVVKNKADALLAYQKYMQDAQAASSQECMDMFRQIYEQDSRHLMEAKRHLSAVLAGEMGQGRQQGQSMGKQDQGEQQGQQGQGRPQAQRMSSGGEGKQAQRR